MNGSGRENSREKECFVPDQIIHEPTRLQIVSYLTASGKQASFTELKEKLNLSAGNLSVQLKRLEEAGYVSISKSFRERKPLTCVSLTRQGLGALQQYLLEMEKMIDSLKKSTIPPADQE